MEPIVFAVTRGFDSLPLQQIEEAEKSRTRAAFAANHLLEALQHHIGAIPFPRP